MFYQKSLLVLLHHILFRANVNALNYYNPGSSEYNPGCDKRRDPTLLSDAVATKERRKRRHDPKSSINDVHERSGSWKPSRTSDASTRIGHSESACLGLCRRTTSDKHGR